MTSKPSPATYPHVPTYQLAREWPASLPLQHILTLPLTREWPWSLPLSHILTLSLTSTGMTSKPFPATYPHAPTYQYGSDPQGGSDAAALSGVARHTDCWWPAAAISWRPSDEVINLTTAGQALPANQSYQDMPANQSDQGTASLLVRLISMTDWHCQPISQAKELPASLSGQVIASQLVKSGQQKISQTTLLIKMTTNLFLLTWLLRVESARSSWWGRCHR